MELALVKKSIFANFGICFSKDTLVEAVGREPVNGKFTRYSIRRIDPNSRSSIQLSVNAKAITILPNVEWLCLK